MVQFLKIPVNSNWKNFENKYFMAGIILLVKTVLNNKWYSCYATR